jgi:microcystin-dependent protein
MSEPFIGEIRMFGGNFAPRGWAMCDGQLLPISQNQSLYSLLGTTYGGDGRTDFGLPDLRGRLAMHPGDGPGLTSRRLGQKGGAETVALSGDEMPAHTHGISESGGMTRVLSFFFGRATEVPEAAPAQTDPAGDGVAHENMPPFQTVNFIIALQGIYPSRS